MDSVIFLFWAMAGPVLPSILGTALAHFARKRGKQFLYKTLTCSAFAATGFPIYAAWSVFHGEAAKDPQAGLVLVFLPLWMPIIFGIAFVLICGAFVLFGDSFDEIRRHFVPKIQALAFKISISVIGFYFLIWLFFFVKSVT